MLYKTGAVAAASFTAVGIVLLTACGGGDGGGGTAAQSSPVTSAPRTTAPAAPGGDATDSGAMDLAFRSGTAKQNNAPRMTGDWATRPGMRAPAPVQRKWVQLSAGRAGALNPVVVNGSGFTLYRFDKDTAVPSRSNCAGECATTWPPVLVGPRGKIFVQGVEPSAVGVITRDDGTHQVTIGGWPVYRFSKDLKPGDTNGQGVGGTWFGVTPEGGKAGQPPRGEPDDGDAQRAPATSAILFDDANFSDNGPAQGIAGNGCQNVARRNVASSISMSGSAKIWTERDCKGRSAVINGDVADLAAIGFDNKVNSVFFG